MPKPHDEDLFESTKMTFGEHLEELRAALFKSLIALVLGFLLGLLLARYVVVWIQGPLEVALVDYYQNVDEAKRLTLIEQLKEEGAAIPAFLQREGDQDEDTDMRFEEVYLDPQELLAELHRIYPRQFPTTAESGQQTGPANLGDRHAAGTRQSPKNASRNHAEGPARPVGDARRNGDAGPSSLGRANPAAGSKNAAAGKRSPSDVAGPHLLRIVVGRTGQDEERTQTKSFSVHEPFMIYIKAALLTAVVLSSPLVFYFIWQFVAAGLYPHERQYVYVFMPFSLGLFLAGAALAFFVVFRFVLAFLFSFNSWLGIDPDPRISEWLGFVILLPLGFGISFQLPLVMLFLERIGIFSVQDYLSKWRLAVLIVAVLSMLLTPADPTSMILMEVPLTLLYFGGILLCKLMPRRTNPFGDATG